MRSQLAKTRFLEQAGTPAPLHTKFEEKRTCRDRDTLDPFPVEDAISGRVVGEGLKRGIFFYGGGTGAVRDIVCMGPPFVIEETDIDRMAETLLECVDAVTV